MPNGVQEWMRVDQTFRDILEQRDIPYTIISNNVIDLVERIAIVRSLVSKKGLIM